jgi:hypothetical protein
MNIALAEIEAILCAKEELAFVKAKSVLVIAADNELLKVKKLEDNVVDLDAREELAVTNTVSTFVIEAAIDALVKLMLADNAVDT